VSWAWILLTNSHMMRPRALVAEDDADLLTVVSCIVDELGIEVIRASDGGELLQRIADDGPFDVIVTDVAMPWMTGLHVMHSARASGLACPVIVMTALRDQRTNDQVAALGDDVRLLHKPFSLAALRRALRALIPRPSSTRLYNVARS
jgi:CheY-like chemotaxis protein